MLSCDTEIFNFQNYLIGFTPTFRFRPTSLTNEQKSEKAKKIVRWIISDVLGWTPQEAKEHFGLKEIKAFKLTAIINKIIYPEDVSKTDYPYLIHVLYPNIIRYDPSEGIINIWEEVQKGDLKKFPAGIFAGESGRQRIYTLLNEFNRRYVPAKNLEDLYYAYSRPAEINKAFGEAKLYTSFSKYYTYPIELLHRMIKDVYSGQEDEYLYSVLLYSNVADSIKFKNQTIRSSDDIKEAEI